MKTAKKVFYVLFLLTFCFLYNGKVAYAQRTTNCNKANFQNGSMCGYIHIEGASVASSIVKSIRSQYQTIIDGVEERDLHKLLSVYDSGFTVERLDGTIAGVAQIRDNILKLFQNGTEFHILIYIKDIHREGSTISVLYRGQNIIGSKTTLGLYEDYWMHMESEWKVIGGHILQLKEYPPMFFPVMK